MKPFFGSVYIQTVDLIWQIYRVVCIYNVSLNKYNTFGIPEYLNVTLIVMRLDNIVGSLILEIKPNDL